MKPKNFEFWTAVDKSGDCWGWRAARIPDGYGMYRGKLAHRVAWEMENGPIPDGLRACHMCDNPGCVRPSHIFLGTQSDNMRDCHEKKRNYSTRGSANGRAKLTEEQVRNIRQLAQTLPYSQIIPIYGVSKSIIAHIVQRYTWKHVA